MIGEPDAGNLHVRFDEGTQETDGFVPRLRPTLQSPNQAEITFLGSRSRASVAAFGSISVGELETMSMGHTADAA